MQLSRKTLYRSWGWTSLAALVVFGGLALLDLRLKAHTGFGVADLQGVPTGWGVRFVMDRWTSPPNAAAAGFGLGLDYLFMPLYAIALYLGVIAARERFAPRPGRLRRLMAIAAMAPVVAAICDAGENALELRMLLGGPTDLLAYIAAPLTTVKYIGFYVGLALSVLAALALLGDRRGKKKEPAGV